MELWLNVGLRHDFSVGRRWRVRSGRVRNFMDQSINQSISIFTVVYVEKLLLDPLEVHDIVS